MSQVMPSVGSFWRERSWDRHMKIYRVSKVDITDSAGNISAAHEILVELEDCSIQKNKIIIPINMFYINFTNSDS